MGLSAGAVTFIKCYASITICESLVSQNQHYDEADFPRAMRDMEDRITIINATLVACPIHREVSTSECRNVEIT